MASGSTWTVAQNKRFENAVAIVNKDDTAAEYWEKVARAVGDKTVEEVKIHYDKLVEDVRMIEQDLVPLPNYRDAATTARGQTIKTNSKVCKEQQKRMKNIPLQ